MKSVTKSPLLKNGLISAITLAVIFSVLAIYCIKISYDPLISAEDTTAVCVFLSIAALIAAGALLSVLLDAERYFSINTIDKHGISSTCLFHDKIDLRWEKVKSCGVCIHKETRKKEYKMLYVAAGTLDIDIKMGRRKKTARNLPSNFILLPVNSETVQMIDSFAPKEITEMLKADLDYFRITM